MGVLAFFRRLSAFRHGNVPDTGQELPAPCPQYRGFVIRPAPYPVEGQYQLCGFITKCVDGRMREHRFIRADRFACLDSAVQMTAIKARQIIDEQGDGLFD